MTRVAVSGVGYVLVIPEGWDRWTFDGVSYRRREVWIERRLGLRGRWVLVQVVETDENKSGDSVAKASETGV